MIVAAGQTMHPDSGEEARHLNLILSNLPLWIFSL